MPRFLCLFPFFLFCLFAQESYKANSSQLGEIIADKLSSDKNKIYAKGNVVLISGEYYISADDVVYDKSNKTAEIKGEVRVYKGSDLSFSAKSVKVDFSKDTFSLSSIYLQSVESDIPAFIGGNKNWLLIVKSILIKIGNFWIKQTTFALIIGAYAHIRNIKNRHLSNINSCIPQSKHIIALIQTPRA